jgi:hypothetical protein
MPQQAAYWSMYSLVSEMNHRPAWRRVGLTPARERESPFPWMHAGYSDHSIDVASKGLTSLATWHDPRRRSARSGKPGREGRWSPSRSNFSSASRPNPTTWGSSNAVVRLVPCQRQDCRVAMDPKKKLFAAWFQNLDQFHAAWKVVSCIKALEFSISQHDRQRTVWTHDLPRFLMYCHASKFELYMLFKCFGL